MFLRLKKIREVKGLSKQRNSSFSTVVTPDENSKSPKSPKSPNPEQRVLRRRTNIIPKKKPDAKDKRYA